MANANGCFTIKHFSSLYVREPHTSNTQIQKARMEMKKKNETQTHKSDVRIVGDLDVSYFICADCARKCVNYVKTVVFWTLAFVYDARFSLLIMHNGISKSIQNTSIGCYAIPLILVPFRLAPIFWRWYSNGNRCTVKFK